MARLWKYCTPFALTPSKRFVNYFSAANLQMTNNRIFVDRCHVLRLRLV